MTFPELLRTVFLSPNEPRLRAGWRLLAQLILFTVISVMVGIPAVILMFVFPALTDAMLLALNGIPMVVSVLVARKWIDRRSVVSLGLRLDRQTLTDVLVGMGISVLQIGLIFVLEWRMGWLAWEGFAWQERPVFSVVGNLLLWLGLFVAVGFYEELFSRGYQLQNLEEGLNTFWAVLLSSVVFGALHLTNPNATLISAVGIMFAGLFLAYPYLRTRQLWLSVGLHIGWNTFLGPVFGFPVSGMETPHLFLVSVEGPQLMTGGAFGPEAGLVVLPALGLGALLVWAYTRGRVAGKS